MGVKDYLSTINAGTKKQKAEAACNDYSAGCALCKILTGKIKILKKGMDGDMGRVTVLVLKTNLSHPILGVNHK